MTPDKLHTPHTIGDMIAQASAPPADIKPADMARVGQAIAQAATQATVQLNAQPDTRVSEQPKSEPHGVVTGDRTGGEVPGAATSAASGISNSPGSEAIERVRRRVSDQTSALNQRFATPWNAR